MTEETKKKKNRKVFNQIQYQVWEVNRRNGTEEMLKTFKYRKVAEKYIDGAVNDENLFYEVREEPAGVL